ncbi:unnamed protein product [Fusarium venenatum]|uniref:Uncharacterized protein n=1 Tax=Fusarium venenatum TaxID=56646 RepID=A0A2L2TQC6_9HYPO|nr:uncharacterized protein FVRRES_02228 [Fusarium venenatum]CEI65716.1 unnamed protein product [Fusarium venenatum]
MHQSYLVSQHGTAQHNSTIICLFGFFSELSTLRSQSTFLSYNKTGVSYQNKCLVSDQKGGRHECRPALVHMGTRRTFQRSADPSSLSLFSDR